MSTDELTRLVERLARIMPEVPRLAILDAVEAEWERLRIAAEPLLMPFIGPAAAWRLRTGFDPAL